MAGILQLSDFALVGNNLDVFNSQLIEPQFRAAARGTIIFGNINNNTHCNPFSIIVNEPINETVKFPVEIVPQFLNAGSAASFLMDKLIPQIG